VRDIGSGINFERPGFKALLEQLFEGKIRQVVVAYPDRFTRFGFDFFVWLFKRFGADLVGLSRSNLSREEELAGDLMEIVAVFAARYHGSRKYDDGREKDPDLP
jgi:predicted site-specific integrase-resolvase